MAKTGGGGVKRTAPIKKRTPIVPPKKTQQATIKPVAQTRPRTPTLPSSPPALKKTPVPQWQLFGGIGDSIARATGQAKGRRRKR